MIFIQPNIYMILENKQTKNIWKKKIIIRPPENSGTAGTARFLSEHWEWDNCKRTTAPTDIKPQITWPAETQKQATGIKIMLRSSHHLQDHLVSSLWHGEVNENTVWWDALRCTRRRSLCARVIHVSLENVCNVGNVGYYSPLFSECSRPVRFSKMSGCEETHDYLRPWLTDGRWSTCACNKKTPYACFRVRFLRAGGLSCGPAWTDTIGAADGAGGDNKATEWPPAHQNENTGGSWPWASETRRYPLQDQISGGGDQAIK